MISIKSKPEAFNYSLSLPRLSYMSTQASTVVTLYKGDEKILEEVYHPFDFKTAIDLEYDKLIDGLQVIDQPKTNVVTLHNNAASSYKLTIKDDDMTAQVNFIVMKGFYYPQPLDLDQFFRTTWLNVNGGNRGVTELQPVYLTAFAQHKINIKVKAIFDDRSTETFNFGTMVSGKVQTVDVSPYLVQQLSTKKVVEYSVLGMDDENKLNIQPRYFTIEQIDMYRDDYFIFLNRTGGWETLALTGQKTNNYKNVPSLALMDKRTVRYADDKSRTVKKNTGYIKSFYFKVLLVEMINSEQCYHVLDGAPRLINFKEPSIDLTDGTLNEADLEFTYSEPLLVNPQLEKLPNYLNI